MKERENTGNVSVGVIKMIKKYNIHISELAEEMGCGLVIKKRSSGMMYVEFGYLEVPEIFNQSDYMVNLHEFGHFALGHTQGRPPKQKEKFYFENGVLRSEAQAWEWAMNNAIDEITAETKRFMWNRCLGTYHWGATHEKAGSTLHRLSNGNRHYVQFTWDKPDEYFWSIVGRMGAEINGNR